MSPVKILQTIQAKNLEERDGAGATTNICKISVGELTLQAEETNNISRFYNTLACLLNSSEFFFFLGIFGIKHVIVSFSFLNFFYVKNT